MVERPSDRRAGRVAGGSRTAQRAVDLDELRGLLEPFVARPLRSALRSLGQDLVVYVLLLVGLFVAESRLVQTAAGVGLGLVMTNLFMIGHDAAHGSFTDRPRLNRAIARLTLTLSFHPVSAWEHVHHGVHHRLTNDPIADVVWRPLTVAEYRALSPSRRWLARAYRTTPGFGLYYVIELWAKELMGLAPTTDQPDTLGRDRFGIVATLLVAGTAGWLLGGWWVAVSVTVIPLAVLSWAIGLVVYFNHTHPLVPWQAEGATDAWSNQVQCTVRLVFPMPLRHFLGNIMEHTAHHVHPGVPLANLRAAQDALHDHVGCTIVQQDWTPKRHRSIVRACRLYDPDRHLWLDWHAEVTAATLLASPADRGRFGIDLPV